MVMTRMPSGFAVIGDTQHLPGYSLLLCDDESVNHPTDLDGGKRKIFLFDLSPLGEAVQAHAAATAYDGSTTRCSATPFQHPYLLSPPPGSLRASAPID